MGIKESNKKDICRFVKFRYSNVERINGKYVLTEKGEAFGLQINDKIFLVDGRYKKSVGKHIKILEEYPPYPEWATSELVDRYDRQKGIGTLFEFIEK